jgi:hypothetical protein
MNLLLINLTFFSFFIGWTASIIKILPIALFLAQGSSKDLALLFLIASILLPVIGFILEFLKKILSSSTFSYVLKALNLFLLLTLIPSYFLFSFYATGAYFVVLQTTLASSNYLDYNTTIGTFLSLAESKKHFGYLSAVRSAGKLGGNLLLPLFMSFFGNFVTLIILFSSQLLIAITNVILEKTNKERLFSVSQQSNTNQTASNKKSIFSPFILLSFAFMITTTIAYRLVDLSGYQVTKEFFTTELEITTFMCYFYLTVSILEIISNIFLFKPFLHYLGLFATQRLPLVVISLFIVILGVTYQFFPVNEVLFSTILGAWFLFSLVNSNIIVSTAQISYESLDPNQKAFVRRNSNFTVNAAGSVLGNGLYALILTLYGLSYLTIFSCVVFFCIIGIILSISCNPHYIKNIRERLSKQISSTKDFVLTRESENYIQKELDVENEKKALYLLQQLEQASPEILEQTVTRCLSSSHISVVKTALSTYIKKPSQSYFSAVQNLVGHQEFVIQTEAIKVFHLHKKRFFSSDQTKTEKTSLLYLYERLCFDQESDQLWDKLERLCNSSPRKALRILKRLESSEKREEFLRNMITNQNSTLQIKALNALSLKENFLFFFDLLKNENLFPHVLSKLVYEKESSLPFLKFCINKEGVHSSLFLKLFPLVELQDLKEISDWIFRGLKAPFGSPLFEKCLNFYTSSALLKIRPDVLDEKLQEHKKQCLTLLTLLHQLNETIEETLGSKQTVLNTFRKFEKILFNLLTVEYKDPFIKSFKLWGSTLDPYKKGFTQEWIHCSFSKEDLKLLELVSQKSIPQEELHEKLLNHPLVSDLLKATLIFIYHPKIKINICKEFYPLTSELISA